MKIKLFYFARLKETLKYSTEDLELPDESFTILKLKALLAKRGDVWGQMLMGKLKVRAAINHELVDDKALINDGDEVAFFPPVTGG
ncbi:MAG: molybdopterin converting factor subunit 1 [Methylotenera sp.]|jgi:molybdopterin synthase sulfur carrier subunit|uniref:molybdopterin converting factor subunit 1 n=1 Tax=Methylotenera sp. TaxID=2051956 RepID=UPI002723882E|nr:molybdopterin converting factor subunit 1 [Methylotenera sp.]MDO9150695.1 molybdopterin converting factor subunit 1 [Methylotenera sp.]